MMDLPLFIKRVPLLCHSFPVYKHPADAHAHYNACEQALWFANCANTLLWWTYVKACWRALSTLTGVSNITFKTTLKVGVPCFSGWN